MPDSDNMCGEMGLTLWTLGGRAFFQDEGRVAGWWTARFLRATEGGGGVPLFSGGYPWLKTGVLPGAAGGFTIAPEALDGY